MEAPAIIVGVILIRMFDKKQESKRLWDLWSNIPPKKCTLILGSLIIGMLASDEKHLELNLYEWFIQGISRHIPFRYGIKGRKLMICKSGWFAVIFVLNTFVQQVVYTFAQLVTTTLQPIYTGHSAASASYRSR
jgi:hypothetical protein